MRFLLSPLIRAAYLGTLTHLHSPGGGDIRGEGPRAGCWLQGAAGSKGPCGRASAERTAPVLSRTMAWICHRTPEWFG